MKQLIKKDNIKNFFKTKVVDFFQKNGMLILFSLLLLIISVFLVQTADNYIMQDTLNQKPTQMLIPLFEGGFGTIAFWVTVITLILYTIIFVIIGKKEFEVSKVFLLIMIPLGIMHMFLSPLGRIPDEIYHSRRAYEVSLGHFITDIDEVNDERGRMLPQDLRVVVPENISYTAFKERIDVVEKEYAGTEDFMTFPCVAVYTFISYVPQAIGIVISRLFTDNFLIQLYCARFVNLAVYTAIIYISLKIIPFKK